jgi:hypothetical protein
MSDVTQILTAIERGDPKAAEQLLPVVYDELRQLAAQKLAQEKPGQTLQATALVHEAYLRLAAGRTTNNAAGEVTPPRNAFTGLAPPGRSKAVRQSSPRPSPCSLQSPRWDWRVGTWAGPITRGSGHRRPEAVQVAQTASRLQQ